MTLSTGARPYVVSSDSSARGRLLAELAGAPARKGYSIAYDLLRNRAEAEEAVQEALARACEAIADLRDPAAAPAWFLRIVTTVCLRTLRRRKLRRTLLGWLPGREEATEADTSTELVAERVHATETRGANDALVDRETLGAMMQRLDALSPQQRTALVLRYGHDLSVPEIAELLGVELATAKTHLVRGLARLRDLMEEHK
jgi:RNA polymerase sigma-70 factor, ECF subfamily